MEEGTSDTSHPVLRMLCTSDRRAFYEQRFSKTNRRPVYYEYLSELLSDCVAEPPLAIVLDFPSALRAGAVAMSFLSNLGVDWPVLRVKPLPNGNVQALCLDPANRGELLHALEHIAASDPKWHSSHVKRHYVRLKIDCRVCWRGPQEGPWSHGNGLNLSVAGAFILAPTPPEVGQTVELEIWDIDDERIELQAVVMRSRTWERGPKTPGFAVRFVLPSLRLQKALVRRYRELGPLSGWGPTVCLL